MKGANINIRIEKETKRELTFFESFSLLPLVKS
jgi:hypothetical protein